MKQGQHGVVRTAHGCASNIALLTGEARRDLGLGNHVGAPLDAVYGIALGCKQPAILASAGTEFEQVALEYTVACEQPMGVCGLTGVILVSVKQVVILTLGIEAFTKH